MIKKVITQGTIINNCVAEKYHCDVYGVIVTPRCDLAHSGKVTHVHYLPIVPLDEWYKMDGLYYLWSKAVDRCSRKISELCRKHEFPLSNLKENQLLALCDSLSDVKERDGFKNSINRYYALLKTDPQDYMPNSDEKNKLIENMHKGEIPAFMLIEDWRETGNYRVILLRDMKRLEYDVVMGMGTSIAEKAIVNKWRNDLAYSVAQDTIYSMEAEMVSPFVEQLMERFSYNFCRIGVDEIDEKVDDVMRKNFK